MLVTVEDGVATKIQGDPAMPFTDGTLCTKVAHYLERTYAPDRLLHPLRRVGRKGKGQFKRISWDEALDEIAARLKALAAENPADHPAVQLCRHDGHGAVHVDGPALLPQARRLAARPHAVLLARASPASRRRSAARSAWTPSASTRRS